MRVYIEIIFICFIIFIGCQKTNDWESFEERFNSSDFTEEVEILFSKISKVEIYIEPFYYGYTEYLAHLDEIPLIPEEDIRSNGSYILFKGLEAQYICAMLFSAKEIHGIPKKREVPKKKKNNTEQSLFGGIVIDITFDNTILSNTNSIFVEQKNNCSIITFVMQNDGLNLFYIKGREHKFYSMPELLIKKLFIKYKEIQSYISINEIYRKFN